MHDDPLAPLPADGTTANQQVGSQPSQRVKGRLVIEPSAELVEEQRQLVQQQHDQQRLSAAPQADASQQFGPPVPSQSPPPALPPSTPSSVLTTPAPQSPPAKPPSGTASLYPQPTRGVTSLQPQPMAGPAGIHALTGLSGSQVERSQPKKFFEFSFRKFLLPTVMAVVVIVGIIGLLSLTNLVPLFRFKSIMYTDAKGGRYGLKFYAKHSTTKLGSGSTALVSKVPVGGKFPLELSIAPVDDSSYDKLQECAGMGKAFTVQNNQLPQTVTVCNFSTTGNLSNAIYVAGIKSGSRQSIISISQDLSGINLSSKNSVSQALAKFGLEDYQDDISTILASVAFK